MNTSYTIEEVAKLLKVSKLTIYDLIKNEELPAYRVGRQIRVDSGDLTQYKSSSKTGPTPAKHQNIVHEDVQKTKQNIVISGQDMVLDILGKHMESHIKKTPLRSYIGSLNGLIGLYNGTCDIVSTHLYDGETGEYNIPYLKKILVSNPFIVINLVCRTAGIYVQPNNPHQITAWKDLAKPGLKLVNREKGSGARVLLDEQLKKCHMTPAQIEGYNNERTSHFSVASMVASGEADIGIGIENAAKMVDVDFIPLIKEQYDLVMLKDNPFVHTIQQITNSEAYQSQLKQLKGYDLSLTGNILYES